MRLLSRRVTSAENRRRSSGLGLLGILGDYWFVLAALFMRGLLPAVQVGRVYVLHVLSTTERE